MKTLLILISCILMMNTTIFAQNAGDILKEVEKNNTTLKAMQKTVEAEKTGNRTGIFLQNPEVEFHYLWGNPSAIGNRQDFSVTQTFDFPTAYAHKKQLSVLKNEQAELEYEKQRIAILQETRVVCNELIYFNALKNELEKRLAHAEKIAGSFKAKFNAGEISILEVNKTNLNLLSIEKELESIETERQFLLSELAGLNGGNAIDFKRSAFEEPPLPLNFEEWFDLAVEKNPMLSWLKTEIEINEKQADLNKALSLPGFHAGYMSESVVGEKFSGISAGISIPLWENKNKVKYAREKASATKSRLNDFRMQFYNRLKMQHSKAVSLLNNVNGYRLELAGFDNTALLQKALDNGEISVIGYLLELTFYYESVNRLLELERDFHLSVAELKQYM